MYFESINPYTQQVIANYTLDLLPEIENKLARTHESFRYWGNVQINERAEVFKRLAALLGNNKEKYAALITTEMGKPMQEALAEVAKCAATCNFYASNLPDLIQNQFIKTEARKTYVAFQPLGVILGIMPWNFPFWQVFRFAVPTLAAGNVVLLKHAPNVIGCAKAIEEAFLEAGFPENVFQNLTIDTDIIKNLLADPRVKGVSLTGSERAGRTVAALAGSNIKKSVLELGGNDAFVVLKDADLDKAVEIGLSSRMQNAGQVCISAKRFIVEESIKEEFISKFLKGVASWKPGNPLLPSTKMGPMARLDLAESIEQQYHETIRQGAVALTEFHREHCLVQPVVVDKVGRDAVAFQEETFGPLAAIISASSEDYAIALANDTRFGLAATLFTRDLEKAEKLALRINAGMVFVNEQVRSDPRYPIGGINNSGYGRELSSYGLQEFVNVKTVYID